MSFARSVLRIFERAQKNWFRRAQSVLWGWSWKNSFMLTMVCTHVLIDFHASGVFQSILAVTLWNNSVKICSHLVKIRLLCQATGRQPRTAGLPHWWGWCPLCRALLWQYLEWWLQACFSRGTWEWELLLMWLEGSTRGFFDFVGSDPIQSQIRSYLYKDCTTGVQQICKDFWKQCVFTVVVRARLLLLHAVSSCWVCQARSHPWSCFEACWKMLYLCQAAKLVRYIFSETTAGRPIRNIADTEELEDKECMSKKKHDRQRVCVRVR